MSDKDKMKAYMKKYYEANKDKMKAYMKKYNEAHREENKLRCKKYYEANKDKIRAKDKAYRETHREQKRAYDKAYHKANKDKRRAYNKAYREKKKLERQEKKMLEEKQATTNSQKEEVAILEKSFDEKPIITTAEIFNEETKEIKDIPFRNKLIDVIAEHETKMLDTFCKLQESNAKLQDSKKQIVSEYEELSKYTDLLQERLYFYINENKSLKEQIKATSDLTVSDYCKLFKIKTGVQISINQFYAILREEKILKSQTNYYNCPMIKYKDWFSKESSYIYPKRTIITPIGQEKLFPILCRRLNVNFVFDFSNIEMASCSYNNILAKDPRKEKQQK